MVVHTHVVMNMFSSLVPHAHSDAHVFMPSNVLEEPQVAIPVFRVSVGIQLSFATFCSFVTF